MHRLARATALAALLVAVPFAASAADLPVAPAPAYKAPSYGPPPFLWSGVYIGGNIGAAWNQATVNDIVPPGVGLNFGNPNPNGFFIGGGQIGANYQIQAFVIGVEADFDWAANRNNSGPGMATALGTIRVSANDRWITTLAARFGVALDHWLIYGKAGGGWVNANNFTVTNLTTGAAAAISGNNTNSGWLVGGGVEYAWTPNWSTKLEFDYLGLRNASYTVPAASPVLPGDVFNSTGRAVMTLTGGVNYLFNFGG